MTPWRGPVVVTGTDTGVGKTIVTAAIAACAASDGLRVAVVKPAQTGAPAAPGAPTGPAAPAAPAATAAEESDVDTVRRLAAPATARALATYPDPLAPLAAARVAGLPPLDLAAAVDAIRSDMSSHDLVLVEGAGGLLVPMGRRWTMADLAMALEAPAVVVVRAGLGTLNHTALTREALQRRGIPACVVIGAWPAEAELVHLLNFLDLEADLAGVLPDGAGAMEPGVFRRSAPGWFTPLLYGAVDDPREWTA